MLLRSRLKQMARPTKTTRRQKPKEQSFQQEKSGILPNHF